MKTKLISSNPAAANEIDWGKVGLYRSKVNGVHVLSTGEHEESTFCGTVVLARYSSVGEYSDEWVKSKFTPVTEPITIQFNCDEE